MPTLYFKPGACSLAPHIVLEWIGAPYRAEKADPQSPEHLSRNPAGAVPVLVEDDGWTLTQAGAILDYLAHKHPEAGLSGGTDARGLAEVHRWSSFLTGDLHPSFFPIFRPERYTTGDEAAQKLVVAAGQALAAGKLKILDDHMDGRTWMAEGRSIVDAYVFPMLRWARAKLPDGLAPFPNLTALHDRIADDAAVKRVQERERNA